MKRFDGSIISSNTPSFNKPGILKEDFGIYRCMITKVLYADDSTNISKNSQNPEVLYEAVILGGFNSGQVISNCRLAAYLGGDQNYSDVTLRASSKQVSKTKLSDHDGDLVYVQFNQGHSAYPIIIGFPKGIHDNKSGTKKTDGPRRIEEYNGLNQLINNNGELITTQKGGTLSNGVFTPGTSFIFKEEILKDEKVVRTFKSGLKITEDGKNDKVTITTSGGVEATIDGKSNNVTMKAGSTEVIIDGASGKISLKGGFVDLGASVSDFVTKFTELATAFGSHTHPFTDVTPSGPVPSMTQPPSAPLLTSVGSQTVKVQS